MNNIDNVIEELSKVDGLRKYIDDDGKVHFTTKTEEQEKKEKEEKLTYEKGPICSICGKRKKDFRYDYHKNIICNKCYEKIWEESYVSDNNLTINVICPMCNNNLTIGFTSVGVCDCGAFYQADYKDEFYYTVDFYKKKRSRI